MAIDFAAEIYFLEWKLKCYFIYKQGKKVCKVTDVINAWIHKKPSRVGIYKLII